MYRPGRRSEQAAEAPRTGRFFAYSCGVVFVHKACCRARGRKGHIYWNRGEGSAVRRWNGCGFLGVCALGLGLGILIAAVFPVGCLMFLVSFLLIACGIACLRDRR